MLNGDAAEASDSQKGALIDPKVINNHVIEQLVDQDKLTAEFKGELSSNMDPNKVGQADDGSIHKFSVINFNEIVVCEFCSRKIWLKKAYKCVYCNYVIHIKCYDKTIGKTICERFYVKNGLKKETKSIPKITVELEDPFSGIPFERTVETADSQQVGQLRKSITNLGPLALNTEQTSLEGTSLPTTPRNMVSNFFSGIRQRKWTTTEDQANKSGFLSSFNLGLSSASRSKSVS